MTKRRAKRGSTVVLSDFEASNSLLDSTCMPESFNIGPVRSLEPETEATEEPLESEPIPEPVVVKAVSKPKRKYKKKSKIVAGTLYKIINSRILKFKKFLRPRER